MSGSVSMIDGHIDEPRRLNECPFKQFRLNEPEIEFAGCNTYTVTQKIYADCVDMENEAIVAAAVRAAKEAGFTKMFLLDKKFVLDALTEAAKKWRADT